MIFYGPTAHCSSTWHPWCGTFFAKVLATRFSVMPALQTYCKWTVLFNWVSEGHYNHLHSVTNKKLLNTSNLFDIAAVMSASALMHAETVGSKIQEHNESTGLYFPFLLVSTQRITSLVAWYWYTRIDLWLRFCWLIMHVILIYQVISKKKINVNYSLIWLWHILLTWFMNVLHK